MDNINFNKLTGKYAMYSLRELPWHTKGTVLENPPKTMKEVVELSGVDYEVKKEQVKIHILDKYGNATYYKNVPKCFATYRTDTNEVFAAVGSDYEVVQNIDAFTFIDNVLGEGLFDIETAGVLGKGETIFVTAKVPGHMKLGNGDDIVNKYILFTNSHDGSSTVKAMLTPVRVVCNNTLNAALRNNTNSISFKHTKNIKDKLNKGLELMKLSNTYFNEMEIVLNQMRKITVKEDDILPLTCNIVLTSKELELFNANNYDLNTLEEVSTFKKNKIDAIIGSILHGPGQDLHTNTALWYFNGVTSYYGNTISYKDDNDKFKSLTSGTANTEVQRLFNKITAKI